MENVITVIFPAENEAYRAFSDIKRDMLNPSFVIAQLVLVKKEHDGKISVREAVNSGVNIGDDTAAGGLIGMLAGVLGGPLGMLFGGAFGTLAGMAADSIDAAKEVSLTEQVSRKLLEGDTALIALAQETDENVFDSRLSAFQTTIIRHDAAVVAAEVERALELEAELAREAKRKMREEKKEEIKQKIQAKKEELKAKFEEIKAKITSKSGELQAKAEEFKDRKNGEIIEKVTETRGKIADAIRG